MCIQKISQIQKRHLLVSNPISLFSSPHLRISETFVREAPVEADDRVEGPLLYIEGPEEGGVQVVKLHSQLLHQLVVFPSCNKELVLNLYLEGKVQHFYKKL